MSEITANPYIKLNAHAVLYYLALICLMGGKGVGLTEGQRPFTILLILGAGCILVKMLITEYSFWEWVLNLAMLSSGILIYVRNGHLEALFTFLLLIGMKRVPLKQAVRGALMIWGTCFIFSVTRAAFGGYPGFVGVQKKVGMNVGVLRYSLGYTHPNVLHMTWLIIVCMLLYCGAKQGKKLFATTVLLFLGNLYIFLYSVSYTGFLVVSFCLVLNLYLNLRGSKVSRIEYGVLLAGALLCVVFPLCAFHILPGSVVRFLDHLLNNRLTMTGRCFEYFPARLLGVSVENVSFETGMNLDSSYAYMLMYQGILAFCLYLGLFIGSYVQMIRRKDSSGIMVLTGAALSGFTEQYLGNLSFKNITLFFLGDFLYNQLPVWMDEHCRVEGLTTKIRIIRLKKPWKSLREWERKVRRIRVFFMGTPWIRCFLPAAVITLVVMGIFAVTYQAPKHIYQVIYIDPFAEESDFVYEEGSDQINLDESLIVGNLHNGCVLRPIGWVSKSLEAARAAISTALWSFLAGFFLFSILLNWRKHVSFHTEEDIDTGNVDYVLPWCKILGVRVTVTNMGQTVAYLDHRLQELKGQYICVSNVHTTVTAHRDPVYMKVQNGGALTLPDGKPLSFVSRLRGYTQADRVAGPDLMTEIFKISAEKGYRHFFFGSTPETLERLEKNLKETYPGINIVGMYSPKYYKTVDDIPAEEDAEHVRVINEANPDFVWVGLGAPKQELWMAAHEGRVNGLMLGVGAGFDFHAGTIKRAPLWIQALYMEWFYRLMQDPKRLFTRYMTTNFAFIGGCIKEWRHCMHMSAEERGRKRLLVYAHYYTPDVASTGQILAELCEGLVHAMDVTIICVVPSYGGIVEDKYALYNYYQQNINGVRVIRVRVPEFTKQNKLSRIENIAAYALRAAAVTLRTGQQDYIFSISQPPILGGLLGVYGKFAKHAKFIYNIQDFNPEQVISVGYAKNRLVLNLMAFLDKLSCRKSDLVITVGRDLVETLKNRFNGKKVPNHVMINNWVDETLIYPLEKSEPKIQSFLEQYGLKDKFIFMYSGNLGLYYDLDHILQVMERFPAGTKAADGREAAFVFVGGGSLRPTLEEYAKSHNMTNVYFLPYQDKADLVYSLNAADVHICVNARGIKGVSCPSKYYGIAAAGKPVLASLEEGSEIRCIIEMTEGGLISSPEEYDVMYEQIRKFLELADTEELTAMGQRSREYLVHHLTRRISVEKYREAIEQL